MTEKKVSVVIPVCHPGKDLAILLSRLARQDYGVEEILLINTDRRYFDDSLLDGLDNEFKEKLEIIHIEKSEFDHGGTRNYGMNLAKGELVLFMTQDAVPGNRRLVSELVKPFAQEDVYVAYARQLPRKNCDIVERYTRAFNYPETEVVKDASTMERYGIKNYFCSDVCAMYHKEKFIGQGGFPPRIIFNEDMVYAAGVIKNGGKVFYAAQAKVIHSHNYTCMEQLKRNFDNGVSQRMYRGLFEGVPSEGEGLRMVLDTGIKLVRDGYFYCIPELVVKSAFKYVGFRLGKGYESLSRQTINRLTSNKEYWKKKEMEEN